MLASEARSWRPEVRVFGTTQADRYVSVRAETAGTVAETGAVKGTRIEEGAMIVRLDAAGRTAQLARAEARLDHASAAYEAAQALSKKEFRSRVQLAESKADLETARAEVAEATLDLANTEVHAPLAAFSTPGRSKLATMSLSVVRSAP